MRCDCCGQKVKVHSSDEGTSSYVGLDAEGVSLAERYLKILGDPFMSERSLKDELARRIRIAETAREKIRGLETEVTQ